MQRSICFWRRLLGGIILGYLILVPVKANVGLMMTAGRGVRGITAYRAAMNWDFGVVWFAECAWGLNVHWETAFAHWHGKPTLERSNDNLRLGTTGPVFRWQRNQPYSNTVLPYGELGVSPAWLSQREIVGRQLSLHFQFEDKIGAGLRFGAHQQFDVNYRFYHYSNASLKRPNSGANVQMIGFGLWFG